MNEIKGKKGTVKFRPKARLLNLLGHELITDEIIAIIELVKNSYDADAREVEIILNNIRNKNRGVIEIKDDGNGMTAEILTQAWMEPARDNKKSADGSRKRTIRFNRLPLGEKGVGRFSADKLGLHLEIVSRFCKFDPITKKAIFLSDEEVVMHIEGKKFVEDAYLDEIECSWFTRVPKEFKEESHGTLLRISQLRKNWTYELVQKVHLGLARLSSPLAKAQDFEIIFKSNEFKKFSGKIKNPLLKIAPHYLDCQVDEKGVMEYTLFINYGEPEKGTIDLKLELKSFQIEKGKDIEFRNPSCGPFHYRVYAFERDRKDWKKYSLDKERISLLNDLCGVSIYRDDFRVLPYGEQGNDWLYLDKRRIQNPGKVLGNDRVIAYVEISQNKNPELKDKTNREGLIEEGKQFADLRDLVSEATDFLGLKRHMSQSYEKRSKEKVEEGKVDIEEGTKIVEKSSVNLSNYIEKAKKDIEEGRVIEVKTTMETAKVEIKSGEKAIKRIDEGKKKLLEELMVSEEQINNLISLSGIGLTAERMTHEFSRAVRLSIEQLQKSLSILNRDRKYPKATNAIYSAIEQLQIVHNGFKQMEPLYYSKRRYTEVLDVGLIAEKTKYFYTNEIKNLGITVEIIENGKLRLDMGKGHLMQVFDNLFDNSLYWLKYNPSGKPRKILIKLDAKKKSIIFADSGPGVKDTVKGHLFNPFVSTKPDGRGLGLYIIQDILQNYKAEIELMLENKILTGANFKIVF